MKRYRLNGAMTKVDNGEWVKFEEAASDIIRLQNRIKILKIECDYFKKKVTKNSLSGDIK